MCFMQNNKWIYWVWILLILSCSKDADTSVAETYKPTPYFLNIPAGFPLAKMIPENPLTVEGVELGKILYTDPVLSTNGRSCSSCHNREKSFSLPLFYGANGYKISVPPHINLAFKRNYNWIGSERILDTLCMGDFGPEFFNTDSAALYASLSGNNFYSQRLYKAFLIKDVYQLSFTDLKRKLAYAITQYMRTIISNNAKYDKVMRGEAEFTGQEQEGQHIFFSEIGDCFHCHQAPLFSDNDFHNNGISSTFTGFDAGRWLITHSSADIGKFATPTLRNIALTAPYMHDGRFANLAEVVEFYNSGIHASATIDPILNKRAPTYQLNLTNEQKLALIAFLNTLTDVAVLQP